MALTPFVAVSITDTVLALMHAGNVARHGLSLDGKVGGEMSGAATRQCEACGVFNPPGATHCTECALRTARPREEIHEPRERTERESVLEAIGRIEIGALEW